MISIYQVIQVVFWFYNLSITFASVIVCMHANWSWSQVLHISYLGIHTATQRRVLQLLVVYHAPYVSHRDLIVGAPNSGVNFWSRTVWSWTNGNMGKATCQQCPNNMLLDNSAVLSVVTEWVIGPWLWIYVMNCAHDFSPLDTQTMPASYPFSWKTWQSYQRSIQQSMLLSWRECVLYNGVIRSATVVVLDMVAVTHIIQPQRASIFGEYKHMQLR